MEPTYLMQRHSHLFVFNQRYSVIRSDKPYIIVLLLLLIIIIIRLFTYARPRTELGDRMFWGGR